MHWGQLTAVIITTNSNGVCIILRHSGLDGIKRTRVVGPSCRVAVELEDPEERFYQRNDFDSLRLHLFDFGLGSLLVL